MRRAIAGLFLVAFCFSCLGCQQNPNAGATAPVPPKGSIQKGIARPPAGPATKPE